MDLDIDFRQEIPTKVQEKPQASFYSRKKTTTYLFMKKKMNI